MVLLASVARQHQLQTVMMESMAHVQLVTFARKDCSQNVPSALINQTKVAKAKMIANSVQLVDIVVQKG